MADQYDFGNLSPIEFEALVAELMSAELGVRFETFSEGADGGVDARHTVHSRGALVCLTASGSTVEAIGCVWGV